MWNQLFCSSKEKGCHIWRKCSILKCLQKKMNTTYLCQSLHNIPTSSPTRSSCLLLVRHSTKSLPPCRCTIHKPSPSLLTLTPVICNDKKPYHWLSNETMHKCWFFYLYCRSMKSWNAEDMNWHITWSLRLNSQANSIYITFAVNLCSFVVNSGMENNFRDVAIAQSQSTPLNSNRK